MPTVRTFVALEFPAVVGQTLGAIIDRLRQAGDGVRWVRPESTHLTLKFLGEVDEARIPDVVQAVKEISGTFVPFTLRTSDVGGFPNRERAKVVWVGVEGDLEALSRLQKDVDEALGSLGFPRDERKYFPHLTLGRARRKPVEVDEAESTRHSAVSFRVERLAGDEERPPAGRGGVHRPGLRDARGREMRVPCDRLTASTEALVPLDRPAICAGP
ncbi:MAG: RNA 2',3'-cyclic phosphodiesterase [Candidatus Latescibacteria bacterium]|jgi:2'-5' RNA ligase|nr:RNA 2',3'-cyclic phosphodiesterase [Candidatus Latescibacterota bacterium]